jgi:hypothetical protein
MTPTAISGYCWPQSVEPGDQVGVHLSCPHPCEVSLEVTRVGREAEVVWTEVVPADSHEIPADASTNGCGWPSAATIAVGAGWPSGYYQVSFRSEDLPAAAHAFFVVRPTLTPPPEEGRRAEHRSGTGAPSSTSAAARSRTILLALATNTWHAYNDFGGSNLYTGATQVSLQRPMAPGFLHKPAGKGRRVTVMDTPDHAMSAHIGYLFVNELSQWAGSAGWPDWEQPFLAWAERNDVAIDVVTNADLEDHPELLGPDAPYRLYLSVGHDEYWTKAMRDTVEGFVARGGNAAFLSGNTAFWQVRLEDRSPEGPAATLVGYKQQFANDPVFGTDRQGELTSYWSDLLVGRPENHMTGVSFTRGGYHRIGGAVASGAGGYTVHRPGHWLLEGTGLGYGDLLGTDAVTVGYECDGCELTLLNGRPVPTGADGTPTDLEVIATAPAMHFTHDNAPRPPLDGEPAEGEHIASRVIGDAPDATERIAHGHAVLGAFTSPGGGTVVTAGTTDWVHGLGGRSPHVEQITENLLRRLS